METLLPQLKRTAARQKSDALWSRHDATTLVLAAFRDLVAGSGLTQKGGGLVFEAPCSDSDVDKEYVLSLLRGSTGLAVTWNGGHDIVFTEEGATAQAKAVFVRNIIPDNAHPYPIPDNAGHRHGAIALHPNMYEALRPKAFMQPHHEDGMFCLQCNQVHGPQKNNFLEQFRGLF